MTTISCPACGGGVEFQSRFSVFQVCPYCAQMLIRSDMNLEAIGKMAQLPPDMSPYQLGTNGKFQKKHFTIVGKQRVSYSEGSWNEWYVVFDDQSYGWLAEAQGFLMMSFPVVTEVVPPISAIFSGSVVKLMGKNFEVEDIKKVTCEGSLGELPVMGQKGRSTTSVDLVGDGETFANIDFSENRSQLYMGRYVEFDELKFSNLRELDGW